jgi:hypothetical protein
MLQHAGIKEMQEWTRSGAYGAEEGMNVGWERSGQALESKGKSAVTCGGRGRRT